MVKKPCESALSNEPTPIANRYGVGSASRLELREQMPHVRLHGLLREEQPLADFPVYEAVGDQLQNLDLPRRRLLLELAKRVLERDHVRAAGTTTPRRDFLEAARMRQITAQDLLALSSVHARSIGAPSEPL